MLKKQYSISIKNIGDDSFSIKKDDNLMHMLGIGYGFHRKLLEVASKSEGMAFEDGRHFTDLMDKLAGAEDKKQVIITSGEASILREWINCICQILIETNGISVKDENIRKFFKLSESFVKKTNPDNKIKKKKKFKK